MNISKKLLATSIVVAVGTSQLAFAGQQKEEDSVYQWGRWAVLSPAAGGEPFIQPESVGADFNARPGDSDEFQPVVVVDPVTPPVIPPVTPPIEPPIEVADFCDPGSPCGYATYSRSNGGEGESAEKVLARIELNEQQVSDPNNGNPGGPLFYQTRFAITDAEDPDSFPDVDSVTINGQFTDGSGDIETTEGKVTGFDGTELVSSLDTSKLSHDHQPSGQTYTFDNVDVGYWQHLAEERVQNIITGESNTRTLNDANGYFVRGVTATVEDMERFTQGRPVATYNGFVLDYASPVELTFDFSNNTFNGNFATANSFDGFSVAGEIHGANFHTHNVSQSVNGSFFNHGFNASGAVDNGRQLGVFSTDLATQ